MPKNSLKFSQSSIEKLPLPKQGYVTYHDTKTPGFALRVMAGGAKSFFVGRKLNGQAHRVTIGRVGQISLEQARKQADDINAQFSSGVDPNQKKRDLRDDLSFAALFDKYIDLHAKKHKATWQNDVATFNRYLKRIAAKKLQQFNQHDIEKLHSKVGREHGIYAANRMLALISIVFNKAIAWGIDIKNPAMGVKRFREKSRDRFLQADELPRFFNALQNMPNTTVRDYIWLSLLTGARRGNLLAMRWQDINFTIGVWRIPKTKNGEAHSLPLVPQALAILQARQNQDDSEYVFPSKTSKSGHLTDPKASWQKLLKEANIESMRLHDLRRTLGSWQASTGASLNIIGKTLAHKNVNTTSIYARLNLDPVRESLETATKAMLEYTQSEPKK